MTEAAPHHPDQAEFLEGLTDAECEMHELGSRLDLPGGLRLRLLQAATRAQRLIDAAA